MIVAIGVFLSFDFFLRENHYIYLCSKIIRKISKILKTYLFTKNIPLKILYDRHTCLIRSQAVDKKSKFTVKWTWPSIPYYIVAFWTKTSFRCFPFMRSFSNFSFQHATVSFTLSVSRPIYEVNITRAFRLSTNICILAATEISFLLQNTWKVYNFIKMLSIEYIIFILILDFYSFRFSEFIDVEIYIRIFLFFLE